MPVTIATLARRWRLTEKTVEEWANQGMPLATVQRAASWRAANVQVRTGENNAGAEDAGDAWAEIANLRRKLLEQQVSGETLKNRLRKFEVEAAEKELVPAATAQEVIDVALGPLISALQNMEDQLKVKCNPTDPELAGTALREWRDRVMLQCSNALQKAALQKRSTAAAT